MNFRGESPKIVLLYLDSMLYTVKYFKNQIFGLSARCVLVGIYDIAYQ